MAQQNTASLLSRVFMLVGAVLVALIALSLVIALLKVFFGLLVFAAIVGGLIYLFKRFTR